MEMKSEIIKKSNLFPNIVGSENIQYHAKSDNETSYTKEIS
jgi:hypothetical protein